MPEAWWRNRGYTGSLYVGTISVSEVLRGIRAGAYRVPSFQRRFVWDDQAVLALLDSLLRGYHIGTLITWERYNEPAVEVNLGGQSFPSPAGRAQLVIDGQQRLGALAAAFLAPRFAVDLLTGRFLVDAPEGSGACPLYLLATLGLHIVEWAESGGAGDMAPEVAWRLGAEMVDALVYRAKVSLVRLPAEWTTAQVVEMFRRLNSTGVRMTAEELEAALAGYGNAAEAQSAS
jgi:hypothetical protein